MTVRVTYSTMVTGFSTRTVRCTCCGEYLHEVCRDAAAVETTCGGRNPEARFRASDRAHLRLPPAATQPLIRMGLDRAF